MFSDDGLADLEMQKQSEVLAIDLHRNKLLLSVSRADHFSSSALC